METQAKEWDIYKITVQESKDQYAMYLREFDDIKKKAEIYFIVCSLFISAPFISDIVVGAVVDYYPLLTLFVCALACFVVSILLLVAGLRTKPIRVPYVEDILDAIGHYSPENILTSFTHTYSKDLDVVIQILDKKRYLIELAEGYMFGGIALMSFVLFMTVVVW